MTRKPVYRRIMDDAPRPVAALAVSESIGTKIPFHLHRRGQLLYGVTGVMRVETQDAAWILPPARALWLPPRYPHSVAMRSQVEMRTVYIEESFCTDLPKRPAFIEIGGLLRELILAALEEPLEYDDNARGGQIARLILTELRQMNERPLSVPMPRDPRLLRVVRALLDAPALDHDLDQWAAEAGASRRTLARLFRAETGLSFAEWRAHLRAIEGLALLSTGVSVAASARAVGYASPSAFSAMVRKSHGAAPRRLV